jgi:hypothetical protein
MSTPETIPSEARSSVTIEETAKGPRVTVKVRVPDTKEQVDAARFLAQDTYANAIDWLVQRGLRAAA